MRRADSPAPPSVTPKISPRADEVLDENGVNILRAIAVVAAIGAVVSTLNVVNLHDLHWLDARGMVIALLSAATYWLLALGKTRAAIFTAIWGMGLTLMAIAFTVAGIRTPALIPLPVLCLAAAWLLGVRNAMAFAMTALSVVFFFVIAEHHGYTPPNETRNALAFAIVYAGAFAMAIGVARGTTRSFQRELQHTQDLSTDLQTQVEELRQSEERFSALFRANPVPSSTNDRDGRIIDVNDAWVALYGIRASNAIGKTAAELGIESSTEERKAIVETLAQQGRVDGASITLRRPGDAPRPFLLYIAPVEFGGQQRLVTSVLDQTDRHAAEAAQHAIAHELEARVAARTAELSHALETLKAAQIELVQSEKLASLGAMVAGISHELNTPIGNAVTASSALHGRVLELQKVITQGELRRSTLTDFLRETAEMSALILRSSERAAEQVRSFKQVAVDRTSERRRSFDLQDLVHDVLASIQPGLRQSKITVVQEIPASIRCNSLPGPIGQILTNLVQNAVLHAFGGRESGRIAITAHVQGEGSADAQVVLAIRDDGVGMSEHTRRHAMDPFFTTRMGQGGSGLGLSVSHHLATTALGGSLSVQSEPGCGCCFTFCYLQRLPEAPV